MAKDSRKSKNFNQPENPNRVKAKLARNRGKEAIKKANMDQDSWSRHFDPLYGVKGKKRHNIKIGKE